MEKRRSGVIKGDQWPVARGEAKNSGSITRDWRLVTMLVVLMILWIFVVNPRCIGQTQDDLVTIRELLLTLERGYAEKDVEKYMSVFSGEEYEYVSDMTTPDDPSDDIHLRGAESERRATIRVFKTYENIGLETTDPEIAIDGDSAEARNDIRIVFVVSKEPHIPESYYAASSNIFYLRRIKGEWKIVRWKQHEMPAEELAARRQEERKDKKVEDLIRDLGDDRLRIWVAAVSDLRKARGAAISHLIEALHSPDKNVRIRATKVLCDTRDEGAVRALIEILEDEKNDVDVRVAAVGALSECDSQIIAGTASSLHAVDRSLFMAAKGSEPKLKAAASLALARRVKKRIDDVYRIAVTGLQHEDGAVREAAAESLGIVTPMRGANLLEQRFKDRNESKNVRLTALDSLKQLRSESLLQLLRNALKDKTEVLQIRAYAARSLAEAKDHQSIALLTDAAQDKKEVFELRKEAIAALGVMGNSKAAKPLIGLLNSSDVDLRREAVRSLERLRDRRALRPLMMVMMNRDEDIFVRRLAGRGIVKIDRGIVFGPLVQIMNDETESAPARRMAAEILALFRDDSSIPPFIEVLKNEQQHWWLRQIAVNHLGRDGACVTTACIEALKVAANDADPRIAEIARDALKKINPKILATPG